MEGMKADSFVLYTEIRETLSELTDQQAGKLFKAIVEYAATGIPPDLKGIVKVSFAPIKRAMDYNFERYEAVKAKRAEAGRKGAESRWNGKSIANDSKSIANDSKSIANDGKRIFANAVPVANDSITVPVPDTVPVHEPVSVFPTGNGNNAHERRITKERYKANLEAIRGRGKQ